MAKKGYPAALDYVGLVGLEIRMECPGRGSESIGMEALVEQVYDAPSGNGGNEVVIVGDDGNTMVITAMDKDLWRFRISQPRTTRDC